MFFSNRQRVRKTAKQQRQAQANDYQNLEQRNLLAVTSLFDGGVLSIGLNQGGETAIVNNVDNVVTVNNQQVDSDPNTAGVQALQANPVSYTHLTLPTNREV